MKCIEIPLVNESDSRPTGMVAYVPVDHIQYVLQFPLPQADAICTKYAGADLSVNRHTAKLVMEALAEYEPNR